jgi:hypothetical protein
VLALGPCQVRNAVSMGVTATQPNPLEGLVARRALPSCQLAKAQPLIRTMPLTLQSFNFSIICDENELEMYDVKQEGPDSTTAFVASEAGKVSVPKIAFVSIRA